MNPRRIAYISAFVLASCVLLLVALAIGGAGPATTSIAGRSVNASASAPSRHLSYSFTHLTPIGPLPLQGSIPILVTVASIASALIALALVVRWILHRGFDRSGLLMLLGLLAAGVLAFELITAQYSTTSQNTLHQSISTPFCEGHGKTIEVLADSCRFETSGPSTWTLDDDLLPTTLEFETAAGASARSPANTGEPQLAVAVSACLTIRCTYPAGISFEVFLGTSTKQDRARDFTRKATFVETTPGQDAWFVSILVIPPRGKAASSKTHAGRTRSGFSWRPIIEVISGAILLAVVLALIGPAEIRRRRGRTGDVDRSDNPSTIVESGPDHLLVTASEMLDGEMDPRTAILRCWLELERLLDELGLSGQPSETADELTARLIHLGSSARHELIALHDLFLSARYSTRSISEFDRDLARVSLRQLRASLADAGTPFAGSEVT